MKMQRDVECEGARVMRDHYQDPTAARPIDLAFWVIVLLVMALGVGEMIKVRSELVDRMQETVDSCMLRDGER